MKLLSYYYSSNRLAINRQEYFHSFAQGFKNVASQPSGKILACRWVSLIAEVQTDAGSSSYPCRQMTTLTQRKIYIALTCSNKIEIVVKRELPVK